MSELKEVKFENIAEIIMGQSPKGKDVNTQGKGTPLLNGPTEFQSRYPVPVQYTEVGKKTANLKDVLFCVRGSTTGKMNIADQEYVIGRGLAAIRGQKGYPTTYIKAVLEYNLARLLKSATGSTFPNISRDILNNFVINAVSIDESKKISCILNSLDNKIELNRQINKTLEEMAQAIFKSWFVDFDPVKAKVAVLKAGGTEADALLAAMGVISGKDDVGLDEMKADSPEEYEELKGAAELFPSAMQDSELGEIPEGWVVSSVGDDFNIVMGQSPPGNTYNENKEGIPFFQGRRDFGWRYPTNRVFCTSPKRMAKKGDTLLSVRAPVGDINKATSDCCIGRGVASIRHNSDCEAYTYYSFLNLKSAMNKYNFEGTVFGAINQNNLKALSVVSSNRRIIRKFSEFVRTVDRSILVLTLQKDSLTELRDSLLPKLLSGELSLVSEIPIPEEV